MKLKNLHLNNKKNVFLTFFFYYTYGLDAALQPQDLKPKAERWGMTHKEEKSWEEYCSEAVYRPLADTEKSYMYSKSESMSLQRLELVI